MAITIKRFLCTIYINTWVKMVTEKISSNCTKLNCHFSLSTSKIKLIELSIAVTFITVTEKRPTAVEAMHSLYVTALPLSLYKVSQVTYF